VTGQEKIAAAVAELVARGVGKSTAAPILYRILWRLGVHLPPPLFQNFLANVTIQGTSIGLLVGILTAPVIDLMAPVIDHPIRYEIILILALVVVCSPGWSKVCASVCTPGTSSSPGGQSITRSITKMRVPKRRLMTMKTGGPMDNDDTFVTHLGKIPFAPTT
jgi:hypothetical protein